MLFLSGTTPVIAGLGPTWIPKDVRPVSLAVASFVSVASYEFSFLSFKKYLVYVCVFVFMCVHMHIHEFR